MKYTEIPNVAITGDQLALSNNSFIRILTGESYSHVATLFWDEGRLKVFETAGSLGGFRVVNFAQWIHSHQGKEVTYGLAPNIVHHAVDSVGDRMREHRDTGPHKYGWLSLPLVWLSQITRKKYGQSQRVCSTLSQYFWNAAGWKLGRLADPGDIIKSCPIRYSVEM